jgi:hypothetical protein
MKVLSIPPSPQPLVYLLLVAEGGTSLMDVASCAATREQHTNSNLVRVVQLIAAASPCVLATVFLVDLCPSAFTASVYITALLMFIPLRLSTCSWLTVLAHSVPAVRRKRARSLALYVLQDSNSLPVLCFCC